MSVDKNLDLLPRNLKFQKNEAAKAYLSLYKIYF